MNTASIAERARYLKIAAISISEGMRMGGFRSCFRGQGLEFAGVREYERGDDIRAIDWNVTARSGKPFVKLYHEERELSVFLVVDNSFSMYSGSVSVSRREKALEAAALIAFAASQNASPVGSVVFDGITGTLLKPSARKDQTLIVLRSIENHTSQNVGSALSGAIAGASRVLRSRSLVVIISDFRTSGYEQALGILSSKHDVLAVRITAPVDFSLPQAGYLPFKDPESGHVASFPTNTAAFRDDWEKEQSESLDRWKHICLRRGVSPLILPVDSDAVQVLSLFFSGRRDGHRDGRR